MQIRIQESINRHRSALISTYSTWPAYAHPYIKQSLALVAHNLEGLHLIISNVDTFVLVDERYAVSDLILASLLSVIEQSAASTVRSFVQSDKGEAADFVVDVAAVGPAGQNRDGDLIVGWILIVALDGFGAAEWVRVNNHF